MSCRVFFCNLIKLYLCRAVCSLVLQNTSLLSRVVINIIRFRFLYLGKHINLYGCSAAFYKIQDIVRVTSVPIVLVNLRCYVCKSCCVLHDTLQIYFLGNTVIGLWRVRFALKSSPDLPEGFASNLRLYC